MIAILRSHPYVLLTTVFLLPFVGLVIGWLSILWFSNVLEATPSEGLWQVGAVSIFAGGTYNILRLAGVRRELLQKQDDFESRSTALGTGEKY